MNKKAQAFTTLLDQTGVLETRNTELLGALSACANKLEGCRTENARLREALRPFAELDIADMLKVPDDFNVVGLTLTLGDIRNARAVLTELEG